MGVKNSLKSPTYSGLSNWFNSHIRFVLYDALLTNTFEKYLYAPAATYIFKDIDLGSQTIGVNVAPRVCSPAAKSYQAATVF